MAKAPTERGGPSDDSRDTSNTLGGRLLTVYGIVTDYTGGLDSYRVKISDGDEIVACAASEGGGLYGVRKHATYPLNTPVIVLVIRTTEEAAPYGLILCSCPRLVSNEALYQGDADVIGAPVGWKTDEVHKWEATQEPAKSSRKNFNNFVPVDGLTGEWGVYSPLGPALHLGLAMAYMRATDRCGVWALRQDELLKMLAKNHELSTFAREYYDSFASGELLTVDSQALYPWEAFGAFSPEPVAKSEDTDPYSEDEKEINLPLQPMEELQRGIFRLRTMCGYPADAWQRFLALPQGEGIDKYLQQGEGEDAGQEPANADKFPGVFREVLGPDGSYLLQSAKSIALEKYLYIPYPIEVRKPHDPAGDLVASTEAAEDDQGQASNATYYASGFYEIAHEKGEDESQTSEPFRRDYNPKTGEEAEKTPELRPLIGLELHGHAAVETIKNLIRHAKNWRVPEEWEHPWFSEGEDARPAVNIGPEFKLDKDKMWMPLPRVKEVDVDHRMPGVRYFASRAGVFIDDDGSVRIEDGYGGQFFMGGGNAALSVPGDVLTSAGRSIQQLAPKDLILRAGRDIDITSSYGDLRLKAEYNLMAIGGNDGDRGGVLIESRNASSRDDFEYVAGTEADIQGLVLSNQQGAVAILGKDLSLIAGYYEEGESDAKLLLQSRGTIHQIADGIQLDSASDLDMLIGVRPEGEDQLTELLDRTLYQFGSSLARFVSSGANQGPSLDLAGTLTARGIAAPGISEISGQALEDLLSDSQETAFLSAGQTYQELLDARETGGTAEEGQEEVENYLNPLVTANVFGSLRSEDDYDLPTDFSLWEFPWQRMARAAEADFSDRVWEEPIVSFPGGETPTATGPWPGVGAWKLQTTFRRIKEDTYYDWDQGISHVYAPETDDDPDADTGVEVEHKKPSDSFLVNFKPTPR